MLYMSKYKFFEEIYSDITTAYEKLEADKESQFYRRIVIRNNFAFLEMVTQIMKIETLRTISKGEANYNKIEESDVLFLENSKRSNGKLIRLQIPPEENFLRTVQISAKLWKLDFTIQKDSNDFKTLLMAKGVRNSLSHPKNENDLYIDDYKMRISTESFLWIRNQFFQFLSRITNASLQEIENDELRVLLLEHFNKIYAEVKQP